MATMESVLKRSPCRTTPTILAQALIAAWPSENLIGAIGTVLRLYEARQDEIVTLSGVLQQQVDQAFKDLKRAEDQLRRYQGRAGRRADLKLILSLYKPALTLIVQARWIVIGIVERFRRSNNPPPDVIIALAKAMNALLAENDLP